MKAELSAALVSLFLCTFPVKTQDIVAKLTDAEVKTLIPIMKAEMAGYTKITSGIAGEQDLRYQLFLNIQSGKTDPLSWLKQHSKHILVPPGATYQAACSREVSYRNKFLLENPEEGFKPSAVPTALFTFGKESGLSPENYKKFRENSIGLGDPPIEKIRSVVVDAETFYSGNGFSTDWGMSSGASISFYHPADEGRITGVVTIWDWIINITDDPQINKQCSMPVMGPVLKIEADYKLLDEIFSSPDISKSIDGNTGNSLKKAGITEDRYALVKASLVMARRDSEYPEGIEVPSFEFTPATQEEREIAKTINMMKENALARKSNIEVYNRLRLELNPILDKLEQMMY